MRLLEPPVPAKVAGEKAEVTPAGKPASERATGELKPFWAVIEIEVWPEFPVSALTDATPTARAKVGGAETVSGTFRTVLKPLPAACSDNVYRPAAV